MADTKTAIGTIINARGVITATKPNGSERIVSLNDWIYADETLSSQFHAFAEIRLFNGNVFELPSESTVLMAETVSSAPNTRTLTPELISDIQEAIARGEDPGDIQPAPAAGEETRETGQIFEPVFIAREGRVVTPESGFVPSSFSDGAVPFIFEPGNGQPNRGANAIPEAANISLTTSEQNLHEVSPNITTIDLPIDTGIDALASVTFADVQPGLTNSDARANDEPLSFVVSSQNIEAFADGSLIFSIAVSNTGELTFTQYLPFDNILGDANDIVESISVDYIVTDDNGDRADGSVLINVTDATPNFDFIEPARLSEADLVDNPFTFQFGEYTLDPGADGLGDIAFNSDLEYLTDLGLSSNGIPLEYSLDTTIPYLNGYANGESVFGAFLNTDGTYKVILYQPLDHPEGSDELVIPIRIDATDSEGDVTTDTINVTIVDHTNGDSELELTTLEDTPAIIDLGTVDTISSIGIAGSALGTEVITDHGRIDLVDGIPTYTPTTHFSGTDTVEIQVQTLDGDTHSVDLTFNVTPVADAPQLSVSDSSGREDPLNLITLNVDELALVDQDGSETLSSLDIRLPSTLIEAGAQLYYNNEALTPTGVDGGATVFLISNPELPPSLQYQPPVNDNTDFEVQITATAQETGNGDEASTTQSLTVNVKGISDLALDPSRAISAPEDVDFIPLNVPVSNPDMDGSETLTLWVGPLPGESEVRIEGLTGTILPDGRTQFDNVTVEQISNLQFRAPEGASGQYTVPITVQAIENDADINDPTDPGVRTLDSIITVTVDASPDGVTLCTAKTTTTEDMSTRLSIQSPMLNETDGSEAIVGQLILTGFPKGSQLLYLGNPLTDVSSPDSSTAEFRIDAQDAAQLNNLTFLPAPNSNVDFTASIQITSAVVDATTGDILNPITQQFNFPIEVIGDVDTPIQNTQDVTVSEDHSIGLNLAFELTDTDGSETARLLLEEVPIGSNISGAQEIAPGKWVITTDDLQEVRLTPPAHSDTNFEILFVAEISENDGDFERFESPIEVTVEAVADTPWLSATAAPGLEDQPIALDIRAALIDNDGSETLSIDVYGVPEDFSLSSGEMIENGHWRLNPDQLNDLYIIPPENRAMDFELTIKAIASETGSEIADGAGIARAQVTVAVDMTGVADTPDADLICIATTEDTSVPIGLDLHSRLNDIDGSEKLSVLLSGVPEGSTLTNATAVGRGQWSVHPDNLNAVEFTPPQDFSGRIAIWYTATATELDGDAASSSECLIIDVTPVVDITDAEQSGRLPTLAAQSDSTTFLSLDPGLNDIDSSESIAQVRIYDVPDGVTIWNGPANEITRNDEGFFTLTSDQLEKASIKPTANEDYFTLRIEIDVIDTSNIGDATRTIGIEQKIDVISNEASCKEGLPTNEALIYSKAVLGYEDAPTDFKINVAPQTSNERITQIEITGLPDEIEIQGSGVLGHTDDVYQIEPSQLSTVQIVTPEHMHGDFWFYLHVTSKAESADPVTTIKKIPVSIEALADKPTIVSADDVSGTEDTAIALHLDARLVDTDGSEYLMARIHGMPEGAVLNFGANNGDGSWSVTADKLSDLMLTPPQNFSGDIPLKLEAIAAETSNGSTDSRFALFTVSVEPAADRPDLVADLPRGFEDQWVDLVIGANLRDTDGSEQLDVLFSGYPEGTQFNLGSAEGAAGSWTVKADDLKALQIRGPEHFSGTLNLTVTARSHETNGQMAISTMTLGVILAAIADAPTLAAETLDPSLETATDGSPIQVIPISFMPGLIDIDGSESITGITLSGLPPEAYVTNGEHQGLGRWYLPSDLLPDAEIIIDANHSGSYDITTEVSSFEHSNGDMATTVTSFNLNVQSLQVLTGNDEVVGSDADETLRGGAGDDSLDGGAGSDNLYGDAGNDTLFFDPNDNVVDGGTGFDTLVISDDLNLSLCASSLENLESIQVADGQSVEITLNVADVLNMTDNENQLLIEGDGDDSLVLEGNWSEAPEQPTDGFTTFSGEYNSEIATLLVDNAIHVMG